jgi:thermostable 8-oxoguanine DNA glycosylase
MNALWMRLLRAAMHRLLGAEWITILAEVKILMDVDMPSDQKREYLVDVMKRMGYSDAEWKLRAGIEIAYGAMKK